MLKKRSSYQAIFNHYETIFNHNGKVIKSKRKIYFRELRTLPERQIIAEEWVLDEETASKIVGHLTLGEIVSFTADEDLKNIEFDYPHGIKEEK
jgi:hypothetical protein